MTKRPKRPGAYVRAVDVVHSDRRPPAKFQWEARENELKRIKRLMDVVKSLRETISSFGSRTDVDDCYFVCGSAIHDVKLRIKEEWMAKTRSGEAIVIPIDASFQFRAAMELLVVGLDELDSWRMANREGSRLLPEEWDKPFEVAEKALNDLSSRLTTSTPEADESIDLDGIEQYQFRWVGAYFSVRYDGEAGMIPVDLNGSWYIYWLLQSPRHSSSCSELRQRLTVPEGDGIAGQATLEEKPPGSSPDAMSGAAEEIEYLKNAATEKAKEIGEARRSKDQFAVDRMLDDLNEIEEAIQKLRDKQGKPRQEEDRPADRKSVSEAIHLVMKKCGTEWGMPRLSKHLEAINTGRKVVYQPDESPPDWIF